MTNREIYLCKTALRVLEGAGTQGVNREAWMAQVDIMADQPLTTAEQEALIRRLVENGWVQSYYDRIRDQVRYVLSGTGSLAMEAL